MPLTSTRPIQLQWESRGPNTGRPLLMIAGFGCQLVHWPQRLCKRLIDTGHRVVVFDNRDVGLSTWLTDEGIPDNKRLLLESDRSSPPDIPYTLVEMAADAIAVLDEIGLESAHICGTSMGGMIAQTLAIHYPDRARSMTSLMSTPGTRGLPPAMPEAAARLMSDTSRDLDDNVEDAVENARVFGSPSFDETWVRATAALSHRRGFNPAGNARQLAAIITQADRAPALTQLTTPATVIHGALDPLVPPAHGFATAKALSHSRWVQIDGMGHDLAPGFHATIVDAITELTMSTEG